ncbi:electron transfer flavoprotein, alpha subunit [Novosphingobium nitrogenifigens DSM 19370]|uniref:Electron transfer flavoprotein subunit alpha n=1 Tax=Novosphingobium nitrogenifigens DSM 19370 TaxID=983920 RepID=F1ZD03_9SPHN|nr:FAD-binding protein [Novosphingobium nitrogenifigens]EGD57510.1 electron transfer flavoprotein, alpha subunit [Novosphingobium nitrogenifigens DSM 19370]
MTVLLMADMRDGALGVDATAKALGALAGLSEVHVLVVGEGIGDAAVEAAGLAGVTKVLAADSAALGKGLAEPLADLIVSLAGDYTHIAAPATAVAKSVLPRVAALLDVMIIPDVIEVAGEDRFVRPIYAGNAIQTVTSADRIKVFTIRTATFRAVGAGGPAPVETVAVPSGSGLSEWVADEVAVSDRPELTAARVVVSGGRGLGSQANFALIEGLADKLGAAVGASRAAVDAGFAPNDCQVGQTGKVVAPELYLAVGISGAIQHLAGMKDSKVIVAVNKDEDAPIFQVADYGLVGDLFQVVPELVAKV